jgi:hypothetical protein
MCLVLSVQRSKELRYGVPQFRKVPRRRAPDNTVIDTLILVAKKIAYRPDLRPMNLQDDVTLDPPDVTARLRNDFDASFDGPLCRVALLILLEALAGHDLPGAIDRLDYADQANADRSLHVQSTRMLECSISSFSMG